MSYSLKNVLSSAPNPSNIGLNNSWLRVENNAGRELFAQAGYITNLDDINISLSASNLSIGSIEINDPDNHTLKASVASIGPGMGALRVLSQDLEPIHDTVSLADVEGNFVGVNKSLSAIKVYTTNSPTTAVSITNPTTAIQGTSPWIIQNKEETGELYSFNNHSLAVHRGWVLDDVMRPVVSIRLNPSTTTSNTLLKIEEYEIGSNNAAQSTLIYEWYEGDLSFSGATVPSWTDFGTHSQYRIYQDQNNNNVGNTFTVPSGTVLRHSGIIVGKNTTDDSIEKCITGGVLGKMYTLCIKRVDSATELDVWFALTCKELS